MATELLGLASHAVAVTLPQLAKVICVAVAFHSSRPASHGLKTPAASMLHLHSKLSLDLAHSHCDTTGDNH